MEFDMEFDKNKVYTAVNAEDLPIGSKCIFADTLKELKEVICENRIDTLFGITDERYSCRFVSDHGRKRQFALAYLIELPPEPKYKPFESNKKAFEATKAHGGWVKHKKAESLFFIVGIDIEGEDEPMIQMNDWYEVDKLFENYVFADDGSPCGELVE